MNKYPLFYKCLIRNSVRKRCFKVLFLIITGAVFIGSGLNAESKYSAELFKLDGSFVGADTTERFLYQLDLNYYRAQSVGLTEIGILLVSIAVLILFVKYLR